MSSKSTLNSWHQRISQIESIFSVIQMLLFNCYLLNLLQRNQLFCHLTIRHVNNLPDHIEKHLNGYRFQKAYTHCITN